MYASLCNWNNYYLVIRQSGLLLCDKIPILNNTLLLSTGALGSFTCSGMTLPIYMGPTALHGIRAIGDMLSNVESQIFYSSQFW